MATVYAVVSGKGGVGKSTLAANVGAALARMGKRVCLVDMDIGLRSQDVLFGLENKVVYDVVDVLEDVCDLKQALMKTQDGIMLLPAAQTREAGAVSYSGIQKDGVSGAKRWCRIRFYRGESGRSSMCRAAKGTVGGMLPEKWVV